jgi:hypothetical protein
LNQSEVVTIEEAKVKYPKQWLGAKVIERDIESGQPLKVRVLAKNMDLYDVRNTIGVDDVCTFYTGPIPEISLVLMF